MSEPGLVFVIDGRDYPAPDLDSLTMGERRVLYDLCGLVQEDFAPLDGESSAEHDKRTRLLRRHPGFMEALMNIGYQRGNPDVRRESVAAIIENTNYLESLEKWADSVRGADDPVPLEQTNSPDKRYLNATDGANARSGGSSMNDSDERAADLNPIGIGR